MSVRRRMTFRSWWLLLACLLIAASTAAESPRRIWIDTDAACGVGLFTDIDDCLAIALLLSNPAWNVVGMSSVFGNAPLDDTDRTLRNLVTSWCNDCISVFRGAAAAGHADTPAAEGLASALSGEPLTVFILGPSTNIAAALKLVDCQLDHHKFVAIAGTRSRKPKFRVNKFSPFRLSDLNYMNDTQSFEDLLESGIDLTLMPFELAQQVTMRGEHIESIALRFPELGAAARRWRWVWRLFLGKNGFYPFDAVSVSFLLPDQAELSCVAAVARSEVVKQHLLWRGPKQILHVSLDEDRPNVTYCYGINARFADSIAERLGGAAGQSVKPDNTRN